MKIWMKRKELDDFVEMVAFDKMIHDYDFQEPMKMDSEDLDKYWIMVGEHDDCRIFDMDPDKITFNEHRYVSYGNLSYGDLIEKDGTFIFYGTHVENGVIDFGGPTDASEEDLFDIEGTTHERGD
jgi:hypothetical protein